MWETLGSLTALSSLLLYIYSVERVHNGEGTLLDSDVLHVF